MSNNPPDVTINLTTADAELMVEHCNANIRLGLANLQECDRREFGEKLVKLLEFYRRIKDALVYEGVKDNG